MNNYKVYLAPLEGLADGPMRKVLCAHGGYDLCFSEFIRVTDLPVSEKTLLREVPEYQNDCKTEDGTDVRIQFLGDNPDTMARSAVLAGESNFSESTRHSCSAKTTTGQSAPSTGDSGWR